MVGNVTQVTPTNPWLQNQTFTESFTYDAADQLTSASETLYQSYQLSVNYGNWGKINSYTLNQKDLLQNTTQSEAQAYTYPVSGSLGDCQTLFAPEQRTITDANNNMATETLSFGINGSLRKREVQAQPQTSYTEYYLFNSAANLKAYSNNGLDFAYYGYNAANTRTYKLSMLNMHQWVNGQPFPLHFLCWLKENEAKERAFRGGGKNPVHHARQLAERRYPLRSHRSAPLPCYGRRIFFITPQVCDMTLTTREIQRLQQWQDATLSSEVPPCNLLFSFLCFVSFFFSGRRKKERNEGKNFYYHTNHLGSTAYVTDNNATITQGFLYAPFGEITTEYAPLWQNGTLPKYAFNAKELDEETGMFYYEARYYKPPVFTSRDAMMDQKPWLSPYHYCSNNPVGRVDPTGCDDDWWEVDGKMVWFANSDDFKNSKYEGKGEYKGKTYQKNGVYYSLFGQHMNANSTNGKITKQIDDAFIEYANYLAAEDEMFSPFDVECHDAIQELTDFSSININIPFNNSKATTGENIYYPNQMGTYAGTADIFYYVVGDKERMKGKLEGFSEGLIQSSKNGLGGPYGFDLGHYMGIYNYANSKYEKDNTIVILRFPQVSDVKNLQSKFYTLFPGSKK